MVPSTVKLYILAGCAASPPGAPAVGLSLGEFIELMDYLDLACSMLATRRKCTDSYVEFGYLGNGPPRQIV